MTVKCIHLLGLCPFPPWPYCLLNAIVEEEMHLAFKTGHLRPSGARSGQGRPDGGVILAVRLGRWIADMAWRGSLDKQGGMNMGHWISGGQIQQLSNEGDVRELTSEDSGFCARWY